MKKLNLNKITIVDLDAYFRDETGSFKIDRLPVDFVSGKKNVDGGKKWK
jgi:hypothetical protein